MAAEFCELGKLKARNYTVASNDEQYLQFDNIIDVSIDKKK